MLFPINEKTTTTHFTHLVFAYTKPKLKKPKEQFLTFAPPKKEKQLYF
jgi:hypothetical protein